MPMSAPPSLMQSGLDWPLPIFAALQEQFKCVVCHGMLKDQWQTECGHRICSSCMGDTFEAAAEVMCPANEEDCEIISRDRMFYDRGMCRDILSQLVYCTNTDAGCTLVMKWSELPVHVEKDCPSVLTECPYGCREKTFRNQMETHKQICVMRPQQCQHHFTGCTFEGSESEVNSHKQTAHQEHFDILVKRVEEVDLKRTRLETRLEEQTNENESMKRKLNEASQKIIQLSDKVTAVQREFDELKAEHETFATRTELVGQQIHMQETLSTTENQIAEMAQRTSNLEQDLDTTVGGLSGETLREMEPTTQKVGVRFRCLQTADYKGVLLWKVTDYARRKQDAFQNRVMSLYSQPFYTSCYGYKMCGHVYLNGDGMGKGTHLSLFFVLMRGEYDAFLDWPFRQKVTLSLLDQSPARCDLTDTFHPDPTSSSFRRPTTEMNMASGCPMLISHKGMQNSLFLKDDTIYMKIIVDTVDFVPR